MRQERVFLGRLPTGEDLLGALRAVCEREKIQLGVFCVIGALRSAVLGYYDQEKQEYVRSVSLSGKYEITNCSGNISLKDQSIFVHAHITLADRQGSTSGGHLMPGSEIFAAEYFIQELAGAEFHRSYDAQTGLSLWPVV